MAEGTPEDAQAIAELLDLLRGVHGERLGEPPETLYHYTTGAGLAGIISSGHIRATNFSFLNDSTEFRYGAELAIKRLEAETAKHPEDDATALYVGVIGEVWMEKQTSLSETYVACFTEARDDLNQWRGYGGSADRYCLGLNSATLGEHQYSFAPVIYSRDEQEALLDEYVSKTYDFLANRTPRASEWLRISAVKVVCRWMMVSIPFLKDAHFASEREWRAVRDIESVSKDELFFDSSTGVLRPYVRLFERGDSKLPVTEVIVQSARRDERAAKAVALLLARHGYDDVNVSESEVPFRWN